LGKERAGAVQRFGKKKKYKGCPGQREETFGQPKTQTSRRGSRRSNTVGGKDTKDRTNRRRTEEKFSHPVLRREEGQGTDAINVERKNG